MTNRLSLPELAEIYKHLAGQHDQLRHAPRRGRRGTQSSSSGQSKKNIAPDSNLTRDQLSTAFSKAKGIWSKFLRLKDPKYLTEEELNQMGSPSFAFIDLDNHQIYHGMSRMKELGLDPDNAEDIETILGHEIGHHVYSPGDMLAAVRMNEAIRHNLNKAAGENEQTVHSLSNLYMDLLINTRLHRAGRNIGKIYEGIQANNKKKGTPDDPVWQIYMRAYELLLGKNKESLTNGPVSADIELDAQMIARVVKISDRNQIAGAGLFAAILKPRITEKIVDIGVLKDFPIPSDVPIPPEGDTVEGAGEGGQPKPGSTRIKNKKFPKGATGKTSSEGKISKEDLEKLRQGKIPDIFDQNKRPDIKGQEGGGPSSRTLGEDVRTPSEYRDLLRRMGYSADPHSAAIQYYRELSDRYNVRLPVSKKRTTDTVREGTDRWEVSDPLKALDIFSSMQESPVLIPGETTRKIREGKDIGYEEDFKPLDLDIYIDCSGSMPNPQQTLSFPVLAGSILARNALRAGSKVKITLWSDKSQPLVVTNGFTGSEDDALGVLTTYMSGGTDFPNDAFVQTINDLPRDRRKSVHAVILSDSGLDTIMPTFGDDKPEAVKFPVEELNGVTAVLDSRFSEEHTEKVKEDLSNAGWRVFKVGSEEDMLRFARDFAEEKYGEKPSP